MISVKTALWLHALLSLVHHSSSKHHRKNESWQDCNELGANWQAQVANQSNTTEARANAVTAEAKGQQIDKRNGFHFSINSITVGEAEKWKALLPASHNRDVGLRQPSTSWGKDHQWCITSSKKKQGNKALLACHHYSKTENQPNTYYIKICTGK